MNKIIVLFFASCCLLFLSACEEKLEFDGDREGAPSVSITHEQVSTIDFATGIAEPPVDVEIPAGEYRSVNLGIEIQDENDDPTIVIEGEYTRTDGLDRNTEAVFE